MYSIMTKKTKKLSREDIPDLLDKILSLLNKEVDNLSAKEELSSEDVKNVILIANTTTSVYKEFKEELKTLQKDLNSLSKTEIARLAKQGVS